MFDLDPRCSHLLGTSLLPRCHACLHRALSLTPSSPARLVCCLVMPHPGAWCRPPLLASPHPSHTSLGRGPFLGTPTLLPSNPSHSCNLFLPQLSPYRTGPHTFPRADLPRREELSGDRRHRVDSATLGERWGRCVAPVSAVSFRNTRHLTPHCPRPRVMVAGSGATGKVPHNILLCTELPVERQA